MRLTNLAVFVLVNGLMKLINGFEKKICETNIAVPKSDIVSCCGIFFVYVIRQVMVHIYSTCILCYYHFKLQCWPD